MYHRFFGIFLPFDNNGICRNLYNCRWYKLCLKICEQKRDNNWVYINL